MNKNIEAIRSAISLELSRSMRAGSALKSAEMAADLTTCLATGLALVITQGCRGDQQGVSDMLDGMTNFIHEEAARLMPLAHAVTAYVKQKE